MYSVSEFTRKYLNPEWCSWPQGERGYNITEELTCPMCTTKLRSVRFRWRESDDSEVWDFVCPRCKTQYLHEAPAGSVKEQSADPRDDEIAELRADIALLQKQVRYLYGLIQELQKGQYPPARPPLVVPEEENHDADHDDFTEKYRHLLR